MSEHILIIEDDEKLANLIQVYLIRQGYLVDWHNSGKGAEEKIQEINPDLVILDVMLPEKSGFDICRDIRTWFTNYILIMTASEDNIDEIVGLELGADDYLAKPIEPRLLLARIRALLRRKQIESDKESAKDQVITLNNKSIIFDNLIIDGENRKVLLDNQEIDLTTAEFDLLWLLASNAGKILSRDDIFSQVRGIDFDGSDRSIDARISRLRRKLLDDPDNPSRIKTVRGKGYLFMREGDNH
ncbi:MULTISPECIES: winged helix-turn-helix domain-containing protein [unclassified Gilliamella]|uniref:winged helix-turn-helix domain-containing protein n=1 Tax=unclassified Gilliamella TaxID=2685620 RepID=UPI00226985DF|nr:MULTISPECIES: winged helix-turn-helix domain-containing protein [unclassified Gilliamella]MCX8601588.1 winged helix-turn-helix domain-containing protein [Gilliamella sp. B3722]MCX8608628.1 winged helix-turn-helix domain-containing protein [Gilliamella sp. B3771]MCX8610760.1 winged helix-turn-helix domain-containing protein [Gilliamella sp. B3891]MCX8613213.1 winged helix-turn-helix domain-containing protein [Gilliamella sp. B3773]MCX8614535.1 winged helix-turn-helix domain-containing protei